MIECRRLTPLIEAKELATKLRCKYFETSARARHNVDEVFYNLVREIRKKRSSLKSYQATSQVPKEKTPKPASMDSVPTPGDPRDSTDSERADKSLACIIC